MVYETIEANERRGKTHDGGLVDVLTADRPGNWQLSRQALEFPVLESTSLLGHFLRRIENYGAIYITPPLNRLPSPPVK